MRFAHCIAFGDVSINWLNSISYIMITSFSGSFLNTLLHPLDQCVQKQFQCNRPIALFIRATQIWETAVCLSRFTLRFVQTDPTMALWNDCHCGEGCFFSVPSSCIPAPKRQSACWLSRELFSASLSEILTAISLCAASTGLDRILGICMFSVMFIYMQRDRWCRLEIGIIASALMPFADLSTYDVSESCREPCWTAVWNRLISVTCSEIRLHQELQSGYKVLAYHWE